MSQTRDLSALIRDQHGQPMEMPLLWTSGDPSIADVSPEGTVKGMAVGQTVVWTSVQDILEAVPVHVVEPMTVTVQRDTMTVESDRLTSCVYRIVARAKGGVPGDSVVWAPSTIEYIRGDSTLARIELSEIDMLDRFGALVMRDGDVLRTHPLRAEPAEAGQTFVNRFRYMVGEEMKSARVPVHCPSTAPRPDESR